MKTRLVRFAIAATLAALGVAAVEKTARADTPAQLRAAGERHLRAHDFAAALRAYQDAQLAAPSPVHLLGMARAQVGMGQLVEAIVSARQAAAIAPASNEPAEVARARTDARAEVDALEARTPTLHTIIGSADGAALVIKIDGITVTAENAATRRVNPGMHSIVVTAPGHAPLQADVTVTEGASVKLQLTVPGGVTPKPLVFPARPIDTRSRRRIDFCNPWQPCTGEPEVLDAPPARSIDVADPWAGRA